MQPWFLFAPWYSLLSLEFLTFGNASAKGWWFSKLVMISALAGVTFPSRVENVGSVLQARRIQLPRRNPIWFVVSFHFIHIPVLRSSWWPSSGHSNVLYWKEDNNNGEDLKVFWSVVPDWRGVLMEGWVDPQHQLLNQVKFEKRFRGKLVRSSQDLWWWICISDHVATDTSIIWIDSYLEHKHHFYSLLLQWTSCISRQLFFSFFLICSKIV